MTILDIRNDSPICDEGIHIQIPELLGGQLRALKEDSFSKNLPWGPFEQ